MAAPNKTIINTIRDVRINRGLEFIEALRFIANQFGFENPKSKYGGWPEFSEWRRANDVDFSRINGPHVVTLLKAKAAQLKEAGNEQERL